MTKPYGGGRVEHIDFNVQSSSVFAIKGFACPNALSQKSAMAVIGLLNHFKDVSA
jgi:hypothetical protein